MRPDSTPFLSTNERKALLNSVAFSRCRLDGRAPEDLRRVRCRFADSEPGCVSVYLGDTLVVAKVTHEIVEPWSHRPAEGQFQVNLEVPGPDGHGTASRQLDDEGLRAQRALERCFKESRCLDLESLCIVPGERVFLVRATATVFNNDGNVIDCSAMALTLALADYRRPDVSIVQGAVRVGENAPVPLNLNFYPLVQTFGLLDPDGKFLVADLSAKEEAVTSGRVVVAMSANREICCLHTIGGLPLHSRRLADCSRLAGRRVRGLAQLLDRAIAARRLDTLELVPPMVQPQQLQRRQKMAAAAASVASAEVAEGEEGELTSGSDMDVESPPASPLEAGGAAYSVAVVGASAAASSSAELAASGYQQQQQHAAAAAASSSASAAPMSVEDTARHVDFGLKFIRNAMSRMAQQPQQQHQHQQPPPHRSGIAAASASFANLGDFGLSGYNAASAYEVEDDEEEVTMVTRLV